MDRRVRWSPSASSDLIDLMEYIATDRPDASAKVGGNILASVETLSSHPFKGRVVPELASIGVSEYRQLIVDPYRIVYRVREDTIDVLVVVDGRRDLASLLMQRLLRM